MLDLDEWDEVRDKMHKFHDNITEEVKDIVKEMMSSFRPELMLTAEKQSRLGQEVMAAIDGIWTLEEEIKVIEDKFQGFVGCSWDQLDIENVDVDFIEDLMLRAKPMNDKLSEVRDRQIKELAKVKETYWDIVRDLEGLSVPRPTKVVQGGANPEAA